MSSSYEEKAGLGIYLYCLARPECLSVVKSLADQGVPGVDERHPISLLQQDELVAVIGEVDLSEFSDQNLQALDWVAPRACRHEVVVETIMGASPVLPVKFGTIFRSPTSLIGLLSQHEDTISRFLEELRDKAEWSVKGYLDEEVARRKVAAADPAIQSRLATLSPSPGARYFQQKQIDGMIEVALRVWAGRLTRDIHEALAAHAVEATELGFLSSAATGRPERMIFNGSFLVTHAALPDFRAAVADLVQAHSANGLTVELQGPWPPYNFCPNLSGTLSPSLPLQGGGDGGGGRIGS